MRTREQYEAWEREWFAPYASRAAETRGRRFPEAEHALRSPYERDRDRIIHCRAFRQLEYKTQVFVNHEGDYYRTRLTHTLEATQIARSVARFLRLNEDLAEAVALVHDVGHPPFGHSGEVALQNRMAAHGGFEHNRQGLRIVDCLEERYPEFPGLNLTFETREGIAKHSKAFHPDEPVPDFADFGAFRWPSVEAQVVDVCDQIAYNAHDVDDGLTAGLITLDDLRRLEIWSLIELPGVDGLGPEREKYLRVRGLINTQVQDLVRAIEERVAALGIRSADDVRAAPEPIARLSDRMQGLNTELREFLHACVYRNYRVYRMGIKAQRVLEAIFDTYMAEPAQLPPAVYRRGNAEGFPRAVCDYLSGMTDREALEEHRRLFDPQSTT